VLGVDVVDQFGAMSVIAKKPLTLCAPEIASQPDHLTAYQLKAPAFAPVRHLTVTDEFGTLQLDAVKPDTLLVPSAKSLLAPPTAPAAPAVDHFSCYKVKGARGAARFVPVPNALVSDQFGTFVVTVKKPKRLCAPADKNGESPGAETHAAHLLCYQVKAPKLAPMSPVYAADQFGLLTLSVSSATELCVPATKTLAP